MSSSSACSVVTLDLKAPEAAGIVLDLAAGFDVLIESFRHGFMNKLGLSAERLFAVNPNLVIVRISGFGQTGPYARRPGFGTLIEAMSGFADRNGFEDREPVLPPLAMADMIAGLYGAFSTMIALRAVEQGGKGQEIDLSLLEAMVSVLGPEAASYRLRGKRRLRTGSGSEIASPRNVYPTRDDRWLAISASTQAMTERLFRVIGRADLNDHPDFQTNSARVLHRQEVDTIIGSWTGQRTLQEALSAFEEAGVSAAPVYDIGQFLEDPQVQARGIVMDMPDRQLGTLEMNAPVPRMSGTPATLRRPAPELGEHNAEIYGRFYNKARVEALMAAGVI